MHIGAHLSISKGLPETIKMAEKISANTFQYFARNPRGGSRRDIGDVELGEWHELRQINSLDGGMVHIPYTVNLATPKEGLWEFAQKVLFEDLERAEAIGSPWLVTHPGSHLGEGTDRGIDRIVRATDMVLNRLPNRNTWVLFETMVGQGSEIGGDFKHLKEIIDLLGNPERIGVCLDTCHIFAAGYDIRTKEALDQTLEEFAELIGLEYLRAIHLNDSKFGLGQRKDRHALIGEGHLGMSGISHVVNHPLLKDLPFFLETPVEKYEEYGEEVAKVLAVREEG